MIGIEMYRRAVVRFGLLELFLSKAQIAQGEIYLRIFRHIGIRQFEFPLSERQILDLKSLPSSVVGIERPKAGILLWDRHEQGRGEKKNQVESSARIFRADAALPQFRYAEGCA